MKNTTKKLETNITLLNLKIDRQIEVNNSSKNAISLIITILALGVPIVINFNSVLNICLWHIKLSPIFLGLSFIIIVYSLHILPVELHTGVKLDIFYDRKKSESDQNYLLALYNELTRSVELNEKTLHNKNSHYTRISKLTILSVCLFLIISLLSMFDTQKAQTGTPDDPDYFQETMIFKEFTTGNK